MFFNLRSDTTRTKEKKDLCVGLTRDVDLHHLAELFHRVLERGDHLLNSSSPKEPGDLDLAVVIDLSDDPLNSDLIGDIQLSIGDAPSHLFSGLESHLPFAFERGVEDVQAVDVGGVGFKERGRYA